MRKSGATFTFLSPGEYRYRIWLEMAEFDVCDYVTAFDPARGFMAFRAGLLRVSTNALTDACQRRKGPGFVVGLKLRDQLVDLLWESCLATSTKVVKARHAPTEADDPSAKRKKTTSNGDVCVEIDEPTIAAVRDDQEIENLSEEVERLKRSNEMLAANHQQLVKKYDEMFQVVQRLQQQQDVSDRLLCMLCDRQRAVSELQLLRTE
jgi:hypothetical protein